jgi:hypothetical protein
MVCELHPSVNSDHPNSGPTFWSQSHYEPLRPQTTLACRRFQSSLAKSSVNAFRCIQKAIGSHDFRTPIRENIMNGTRPTCDNTLLTWEDHISITYYYIYYIIMLHISTILNWSPQKESCHPCIRTLPSSRSHPDLHGEMATSSGAAAACAPREWCHSSSDNTFAWDNMGSFQVFFWFTRLYIIIYICRDIYIYYILLCILYIYIIYIYYYIYILLYIYYYIYILLYI